MGASDGRDLLMTATIRFRNHRGDLVDAPSFSATDAKNAFGRILEAVLRSGRVIVTRHHEPKAVLLSLEEYESLAGSQQRQLESLSEEFDTMLARMQEPSARAAMQNAFEMTPAELGNAALEGARRHVR